MSNVVVLRPHLCIKPIEKMGSSTQPAAELLKDACQKFKAKKRRQNGTDTEKWVFEEHDALEYLRALNEITTKEKLNSKQRKEIEDAKTALLEDVFADLNVEVNIKKRSKYRYVFLSLLALVGIPVAAGVGIDSGASIIKFTGSLIGGVNITLALGWLVIPVAVLTALSIFMYLGFDFREMNKSLGVSLFDVPSLLTRYYAQKKQLEGIYNRLKSELNDLMDNKDQLSEDDRKRKLAKLKEYQVMADTMKLDVASKSAALFKKDNSVGRKILRVIISVLSGTLLVAEGCFMMQSAIATVVSFIIAGPTSTAAAITSAAVLTATAAFFATPVGAALMIGMGILGLIGGLASYIYLERKGIVQLIDKIAGRPHKAEKQVKKLDDLEQLSLDTKRFVELAESKINPTPRVWNPVVSFRPSRQQQQPVEDSSVPWSRNQRDFNPGRCGSSLLSSVSTHEVVHVGSMVSALKAHS